MKMLFNKFGATTAVRFMATMKPPKLKMKPIQLKTPPEQTATISRAIFDILKEHGPLTIADTWDRIKGSGLRGLTSKRHMKIVLRWMRERQKLRLICNHVGPTPTPTPSPSPNKQFLYTTWFTKSKPNILMSPKHTHTHTPPRNNSLFKCLSVHPPLRP